jgi:NADH:ubiquinone oxidoreductase subunit K
MSKFKNLFFPFVIFVLVVILFITNYSPNTYLTGWDNLHPEFNFSLNIKRSLSAVWQEYQGLGLLGGMAHSADLPRQVILAGLPSLMPVSFLRYFWTFLMLLIGPLGVYFLVANLLDSGSSPLRVSPEAKTSRSASAICAFASSVFYLFNLVTVQYFFVPFETFTTFYGFLPWFFYFASRYLKTGKGLLFYALTLLIGSTAFYVQTLFVVYFILLLIFGLFFKFKNFLKLILVTLAISSFWLLPATYFTLTNGDVPTNSKINSIATPETKYMNQARSDFESIATLKGYWFDYYDWNSNENKFDYLYKDWIDYVSGDYVRVVGISLFAISILGLLFSRQLPLILMFLVSIIMLSGIDIKLPILSEAFRNAFTKWSVALAFVMSLGLGFFVTKFKKFAILPALLIIGGSLFTVWPVFNGNLISQTMRVDIPDEYFEVFNFFNERTNGGRVAVLPSHNFWGWQFHNWGYRGSGFYWYGIKNPILDRAFDVWSKDNENFYEELNYALNSDDKEILKYVFDKYQVSYILYDKNLFVPESIVNVNLSSFNKIAEFGKIEIYETGYFGDYVTTPKYEYSNSILKVYEKVDGKFLANPVIVENFGEDQGYKEIRNCDLFEKGNVKRERRSDGNLYQAYNGGVACDYFYYSQVDNSKPFIIRIRGENLSGRGLKIYLYNVKAQKNVLEELLPEGKFDEYFFVNPIFMTVDYGPLFDLGYTLSVETRSFGKVESINLITDIEIYQSQGDTLRYQNLKLRGVTLQSDDLEILDVKKYGTWGYKIETRGDGILQLNQAFGEGWVSYPKLQHIKINGWANGWIISQSQLNQSKSIEVGDRFQTDFKPISTIYYIVYWPQGLQWVGFLVSFLTVLILIVKSNKLRVL